MASQKRELHAKIVPGNLPHHEADNAYLNLTEKDGDEIDEKAIPHSWSNCLGSTFYTRIGPDYHLNGLKDTSAEALYEVFAISVYKNSKKVQHFSRFVDFVATKEMALKKSQSSSLSEDEGEEKHPCKQFENLNLDGEAADKSFSPDDFYLETPNGEKIPEFIVVNCMFPDYAPSAFSRKEDGEGYNMVLFLRMSEKTKKLLLQEDPGPALRLLKRFILCQPHKDDEHFDRRRPLIRQKFKVITRVMNVSKTKFNRVTKSCVTSYNAKPFLARTSSSFYSGPGYFETDVDVHKFGYPAKLGLSGVKECIQSVVFDFGFLIQAEDNDELPEQMLASCRVSKSKLSEFEDFPKELLVDNM